MFRDEANFIILRLRLLLDFRPGNHRIGNLDAVGPDCRDINICLNTDFCEAFRVKGVVSLTEEQAVYQSKYIPKTDAIQTLLTDSRAFSTRFGQTDVVDVEWARQLERDVRILALRLLAEDEITFAPETIEVMARWKPEVLKVLKGGL